MDEAALLALLRYGFLAALYLFLLAVVLAIYRDLRVTSGGGYLAAGQVEEEPEPAHAAAPLAYLEQTSGQPLPGGARVALSPGVLTAGRHPDCDLVLPAPNVSARHFRVHLGEAGPFLEDLASTNGTYLNGQRVLGRAELHADDQIAAGPYTFIFHPHPR